MIINKQVLLNCVNNYLKQSTMHGFPYFSLEGNSGRLGKLYWAISLILGACFWLLMVYYIMCRYQTNFTETNLSSNAFPVWQDPFPGVTICNYNLVYGKHTTKVVTKLQSLGFNNRNISNFLSNLNRLIICNNCNNSITKDFDITTYDKMHKALENMGYGLNKMMKDLAHPCENMLKKCYWRSKEVQCMDVFKFVKTSNGFCCAFSYFGSPDVQTGSEAERVYTSGAGANLGLQVTLDSEGSQYVSSFKDIKGFDVLVRNGNDYANMRLISKTLRAGEELNIGLYVTATKSEPDVKYMETRKRGCYFSNEGNLKLTKIYTFQNCLSECRTLNIYKYCDCIPFMFPVTDPSYRVCTLADVPCLRQKELNFSSMVVMSEVGPDIISKIDKRVGKEATKCHCLPDCDEMKYEFFIDRSDAKMFGNTTKLSMLNVFYNSISATKNSRVVSVPWDLFVASVGGIFGLCLGGSVISFVEFLIVFLTDVIFNYPKKKLISIDENKDKTNIE